MSMAHLHVRVYALYGIEFYFQIQPITARFNYCSTNLLLRTFESFKVPIVANQNGVCLQNTSKSHSYNLNMAIILTLWIRNGAVLKSSSQWQLKEF